MKEQNYVSPESRVIEIRSGYVICASNSAGSPDKEFGFEWNDDLY